MIYLIDASVYVFRAYYSIPEGMVDNEGRPTNAVYGFTRFLLDLLESTRAEYLAVAFDESLDTSFRNGIYPAYKANREPAPEQLQRQFDCCKRLAAALGIATLASADYEADDIIGTLVSACQRAGRPAVVVSSDKDLAQLIGPQDQFWNYASGKRLRYDQVQEQFGARPERMADYLALTGDSVDNIPGVPGIGRKTAAAIFAEYRSLDHVYENLDALHALPVRGAKTLAAKLAEHRDIAYLARELTTIYRGIPLTLGVDELRRTPPRRAELEDLFDELGFGAMMRSQAIR
jgi:5'-3' exonuclease